MPKTAASKTDLHEILENIPPMQKELDATVDETRLDDDGDIKTVVKAVAAGAARQAEYFLSGRHERPDSLISTWYPNDDRRACEDFNSFFFGDEIIKKYTQWRRSQSFGMSPTERTEKIAALKAKIKAAWSKVSDLLDDESDFPGNMPPEIFLRWDDTAKTCDHKRFLILHDRAERNWVANMTLAQTYQTLDEEKSRLQHHLRMMEGNQHNSRDDVEDVKKQISEIDEKRRAAQAHREEQVRAMSGSIQLYGTCLQFLRDHGINGRDTKFLLLGRRDSIRPFIDPLAEGYKQRRAQDRRAQG